HDEVRVLGGDLGAVDSLALEAALLDHPRGDVAGRVLPHAAGRGQRQRLGRLLDLEPLLHLLLDLGHRPPVQAHAATDQHGADRLTPAPAIASSPWNSARPRHPSSRRTTPRTPRSLTSMLLPPPMTETGSCSRSANIRA